MPLKVLSMLLLWRNVKVAPYHALGRNSVTARYFCDGGHLKDQAARNHLTTETRGFLRAERGLVAAELGYRLGPFIPSATDNVGTIRNVPPKATRLP
jgi:hypothetical protein